MEILVIVFYTILEFCTKDRQASGFFLYLIFFVLLSNFHDLRKHRNLRSLCCILYIFEYALHMFLLSLEWKILSFRFEKSWKRVTTVVTNIKRNDCRLLYRGIYISKKERRHKLFSFNLVTTAHTLGKRFHRENRSVYFCPQPPVRLN